MKKVFAALAVVSIVYLSSCSSASSILGGSWSFKGVNYSAVTAIGSTTAKTLTATTGSTSEVDDVVCRFTSYPPAPGTYTIINSAGLASQSANQVYIVMNLGTKAYTIDNNGSASATVTVSGTKVSVNVPAVQFSNVTVQATDAGSFTAAITQNL